MKRNNITVLPNTRRANDGGSMPPMAIATPEERAAFYALSHAAAILQAAMTIRTAEGPEAALDALDHARVAVVHG